MSISLPDSFDGELQLVNYAPLAGTTDAVLDTTLANKHVDVRIMLQTAITRTRIMSDLDGDEMDDVLLDADDMTGLESVVKVPAEGWANTGTGVTSFDVAARAAYKGWRSIKAICSGAQLDGVFESTPSDPDEAALGAVDVSAMDFMSIVLDQSSLTHPIVTVVLYLTSDVNGFGGTADSDPLVLTNDRGSEWRIVVSGITGGVDFDPTAVTGVKLEFVDDGVNFPLATEAFHIFSLRAYQTDYDPFVDLDLNTRRGALGVPVSFSLADPTGVQVANFIRGTGATSDPTGQDATSRMVVRLGTLFASGSTNKVGFKFRETVDGYVFAQLVWNDTTATWTVGTQAGTLDTHVVGTPWTADVVPNELLVIEARLVGDKLTTRIYLSNNNEQIGLREYTRDVPGLAPSSGRIGWYGDLKDRDAYLLDYDGFFTSLASGVTKVRKYLSPIESLALSASFAADSQNFTDFSAIGGIDVTQDATKFVAPATFSWATRGQVISNSVRIKNVAESYLDFDIWVPLEAVDFPALRLVSDQLAEGIDLAPLILQPNQWNHIHVELADAATSALAPLVDDVNYSLVVSGPLPYTYYISNMGIFTRNVSWLARVNSNFNFREFRDMVNAVDGLLHFPREERGTELQIAFAALTAEAWAASFTSQVKYAQLGLPVYYRMDDQSTD